MILRSFYLSLSSAQTNRYLTACRGFSILHIIIIHVLFLHNIGKLYDVECICGGGMSIDLSRCYLELCIYIMYYVKLVEVGTPIASGKRVHKGYCLEIDTKRYYNNITSERHVFFFLFFFGFRRHRARGSHRFRISDRDFK